jgi:two-component system sensor histidine kinase KdpD
MVAHLVLSALSERPLFADRRPPQWAGVLAAGAGIALATLLVYVLDDVAPVVSLGVVYLPVVLLVAVIWGARLGIAASVAAALTFNFFHIPPTGRLSIAEGENWVALVAFVVCALVVSAVAELARRRGDEAEARAHEADLAAELARGMLAGLDLDALLRTASRRVADALGVDAAAIVRGARQPRERETAFALRDADDAQIATLLLPAGLDAALRERLDARVIPSLQVLVAAALQREALLGEVVETAALRRSDDLKTAILRAVSHDLRSPLTAILTAGHALGSDALQDGEREALAEGVVSEGERLERVITNLLDLSRLEAGTAQPRRDWVDLADVLEGAAAGVDGDVRLSLDGDLPPVRADAVQLERAFANLIDNAARHSDGRPVSVRARAVRDRLLVRVVDQGPGISAAEQPRVFEAFYKGDGSHGSGLGLAIVRGFVEANDGHVTIESLPGQGTSFVVEFPLEGAS